MLSLYALLCILSDESLFMYVTLIQYLQIFMVASGFPVVLASNVIDGHGCMW